MSDDVIQPKTVFKIVFFMLVFFFVCINFYPVLDFLSGIEKLVFYNSWDSFFWSLSFITFLALIAIPITGALILFTDIFDWCWEKAKILILKIKDLTCKGGK